MKQKLITLLIALKLFDPDATLSLSNVLMMVLTAKLALTPFDWTVIAPLLLILVNHNLKKVHLLKVKGQDATNTKDMAEIKEQIKGLISAVSMKDLRR